jgi:hypothetical protein
MSSLISIASLEVLLKDAALRDIPTARRYALLKILWDERYLTREQLIARVEFRLGKGCFGASAWEDNFYRDLRVVKRAFRAAGQQLAYSRDRRRSGYYLKGQPALSEEFRQKLLGSAAEIDPSQIDVYRRLPASERFRQGCSISDTARRVVAYRIQQERPGIDPAEAHRLALQRAYTP